MNKPEVIQQLSDARAHLLSVASKFPDDEPIVGTWTKREFLAHIIGWEEEGLASIPAILEGQRPPSFRTSVNKYNEKSIERWSHASIPDLLSTLSQLRDQFLKSLEKLSEAQINGFYGTKLSGKPINIQWIIDQAIEHDLNHANELEGSAKP